MTFDKSACELKPGDEQVTLKNQEAAFEACTFGVKGRVPG